MAVQDLSKEKTNKVQNKSFKDPESCLRKHLRLPSDHRHIDWILYRLCFHMLQIKQELLVF